ncbi:MAG: hypothetical protein HY616_12190 [Candidatus Rokubacteria bacterium]|nr:hypothetical protein [Candidatus Rokubacteria bacterium]
MAKLIRRASRRSRTRVALLVGTRKGAFIYHGDPGRAHLPEIYSVVAARRR